MNKPLNIILASGSPRRRDLLTQAGIDFSVMPVDIDESIYSDETPQDYICRMVSNKADAGIHLLLQSVNPSVNSTNNLVNLADLTKYPNQPYLLLTADTIGVLDKPQAKHSQADYQQILIKPKDRNHAYQMWQQMSGRSHQVCTAVQASLLLLDKQASDSQILNPKKHILWQQQFIEATQVTFIDLTSQEMARYWQTGEPLDKAGGYAIQGGAAAWVSCINGSYTNVVGLPLAQTIALIQKASQIAHQYIN